MKENVSGCFFLNTVYICMGYVTSRRLEAGNVSALKAELRLGSYVMSSPPEVHDQKKRREQEFAIACASKAKLYRYPTFRLFPSVEPRRL